MSEKLQSELFTRLDAIAAKMGVGAGELWRILIKQAWVESGVDLSLGFVLLGIALIGYKRSLSLWKTDEGNPMSVLLWIGCAILCVISLGFISGSIQTLFNPEYWAYKHLMDGLK